MKKILGLIIMVLSLSSCFSDTELRLEDLNKKLENDTEIRTGVLENGLRYSIRKNTNPEKRVEFRLGIKGGSLIEKEGERGVAHFIEHMAFNGTEHFSQQELFQFSHKNGVQFGPDFNAFTSHTETVYRFSLPADDQENIDKGFLLLRDWATGIKFEKQEVENEKNIILEELRLRNHSNNTTISCLFPYIYGPLYLQRLPIGYQDVIEKITDETLKSAYYQWYQPGHMSVAIVGDMDMDKIESGIKSSFSQLKNTQHLPDLKNFEIPESKTIQYLTLKDRDLMESSIKVYQHIRADSRWEKESDFRQHLIEQLHIAVFKNRFMDQSNQEQSFHQINYFLEFLTEHRKVLCFEAKIKENGFKQCYKDIFTEYERLLRYGVSEPEITEAGNLILNDAETRCINQGSRKSEDLANMDIIQSLKQHIQLSPESYKKLCQKYLPTIKKEDLNNFFNQFDMSNRIMVSLENEAQLQYLPTSKEITEIDAEIRSGSVGPYVPSQIKSTGTSNASASGKIVKKTYYEKIDVTVLDLSNGARVILKPTKSQQNDIRFLAYSPGGLSLLRPELIALRDLADPVFQNSGIGDYTKQALYRILKHELYSKIGAKKIKANIYIDNYEEGITGELSSANMPLFFQLINLGMTHPRFDENVFDEHKKKLLLQVQQVRTTAFWKFSRKMIETAWPDNEYTRPVTENMIISLDADLSRKILTDRFKNAGDFIFQFVGDFKMDEILPLIEEYLAGLPAGKGKEQVMDLNANPLPGKHTFSINESLEDKSTVIIQLNHEHPYSLKRAWEANALETILRMKIIDELREKQGLIYSADTAYKFYPGIPSPVSQMIFHFSCAPENVEKVINGLTTIFKNLRDTSVTKDKIEEIKKIQLNNAEKARMENIWWSSILKPMIQLDQNINDITDINSYIQELTPVTLQNHAEKYLDETNMLIGVLNPKKGQ